MNSVGLELLQLQVKVLLPLEAQMDIGGNSEARNVLLNIILNAKHDNHKLFFSNEERKELGNILDHKNAKSLVGKSPSQIFGDKVERINQALSSKYGIETINKAYLDEMNSRSNKIEKVVHNIKHSAANVFYDTDLGRALLLDYNNQYGGIDRGGLLENYMNGKEVTMFTGKKLSIADKQEITFR